MQLILLFLLFYTLLYFFTTIKKISFQLVRYIYFFCNAFLQA